MCSVTPYKHTVMKYPYSIRFQYACVLLFHSNCYTSEYYNAAECTTVKLSTLPWITHTLSYYTFGTKKQCDHITFISVYFNQWPISGAAGAQGPWPSLTWFQVMQYTAWVSSLTCVLIAHELVHNGFIAWHQPSIGYDNYNEYRCRHLPTCCMTWWDPGSLPLMNEYHYRHTCLQYSMYHIYSNRLVTQVTMTLNSKRLKYTTHSTQSRHVLLIYLTVFTSNYRQCVMC